MSDEILEQEVREQLASEGLDEDSIDMLIADMENDGMFNV